MGREPSAKHCPISRAQLGEVAKRIVYECHAKTSPPYKPSPIGIGGKCDDTCCIVGEVVEWTEKFSDAWKELRRQKWWESMMFCGGNLPHLKACEDEFSISRDAEEEYQDTGARVRNYPTKPDGSFSTYWGGSELGSFSEYQSTLASRRPASIYSSYATDSSFASGFSGATARSSFEEKERCSIM